MSKAGASKAGSLGEVKDERMSENSKSALLTRECQRFPKVTKRVVCQTGLCGAAFIDNIYKSIRIVPQYGPRRSSSVLVNRWHM